MFIVSGVKLDGTEALILFSVNANVISFHEYHLLSVNVCGFPARVGCYPVCVDHVRDM